MRIKLVSFVLVTIGLFLCTIEDGPPSAAAPKTSLTPAAGSLTHLPGLGEDDESGLPGAAALMDDNEPKLPKKHGANP